MPEKQGDSGQNQEQWIEIDKGIKPPSERPPRPRPQPAPTPPRTDTAKPEKKG